MMKHKVDILGLLLFVALGIFVLICISPLVTKQGYDKPTPTLPPSSTPEPTLTPTITPTVMAQSVPTTAPQVTPTPIPRVIIESMIIADSCEYYRELLDNIYGGVDDVVVVQMLCSDNDIVVVVLAKIDGMWMIMELLCG